MSKLARMLMLGATLAAMSLGGIAHAQSSDTASQQAGTGQPAPPPATPPPATPPPPTQPPDSTPPAPRELSVAGSSRQGQVGTTVALIADLGGCPQPINANGLFLDHAGRVQPLAGQTVTGDGRLIARYTITARDAVGWGRFKVVCFQEMNVVGRGNFSFRVLPTMPTPRPPVRVAVSPPAGRAGTVVTVTADIRGGCDPAGAFFQDRKGWGVSAAAKPATIVRLSDRQLVARY